MPLSYDEIGRALAAQGAVAVADADADWTRGFFDAVYGPAVALTGVTLTIPPAAAGGGTARERRRRRHYLLDNPLVPPVLRDWLGGLDDGHHHRHHLGLTRVWYTTVAPTDEPVRWRGGPHVAERLLADPLHRFGTVDWSPAPGVVGPLALPPALRDAAPAATPTTGSPALLFAVGGAAVLEWNPAETRVWRSWAPAVWTNDPPRPLGPLWGNGGGGDGGTLDDADNGDDARRRPRKRRRAARSTVASDDGWYEVNQRLRGAVTSLLGDDADVLDFVTAWNEIPLEMAEEAHRQIRAAYAADGATTAALLRVCRFEDHFVLLSSAAAGAGVQIRLDEPGKMTPSPPTNVRRGIRRDDDGPVIDEPACPRDALFRHVRAHVWGPFTMVGAVMRLPADGATAAASVALPCAFRARGCREISFAADGVTNAVRIGGQWHEFEGQGPCLEVLRRADGGAPRHRRRPLQWFVDGGGDHPSAAAAHDPGRWPVVAPVILSRRLNGNANALVLAALLVFLNPLVPLADVWRTTAPLASFLGADVRTMLRTGGAEWLRAWQQERRAAAMPNGGGGRAAWWSRLTVRAPAGMRRLNFVVPSAGEAAAASRRPPADDADADAGVEPVPAARSHRNVVHEDLRNVRIGKDYFAAVRCPGDARDKRRRAGEVAATIRREAREFASSLSARSRSNRGTVPSSLPSASSPEDLFAALGLRARRNSRSSSVNAFDRLVVRHANKQQQRCG
jgi:hypothetical protein